MADQLFYTGFEGGARDQLASLSATGMIFLDDGNARTGQWLAHCQAITAAAAIGYGMADVPTPGQAIADGNYATARARIYFQLFALPSVTNVNIFGFGIQPANFAANLVMNTTGNVAAALDSVGAYSSFALSVFDATHPRWYKAELTLVLTNPAVGNTVALVTVDIYDDTGALVGTVTHTKTFGVLVPSVLAPNYGHSDAVVSTYQVRFDDWVTRVQDNGAATLPIATRVTRIDSTGQFSITGFTGDWRTTIDIPRETATTHEQATAAVIGSTTFSHETADELLLENIEALTVYAQVKETGATADNTSILIGTVPTAIALGTAYPTRPYAVQRWLPLNNSDFTNLTWGVRVNTANSVQVAQVYAEVLHDGKDIFAQRLVGTNGWKHKTGSYVGNGTYLDIIDVGFRPQIVIVKKCSGPGSAGTLRLGCHGGSQSKPMNSGVSSISVMRMSDTGFLVGPSAQANASGIIYEYLAIQDGGFDQDCKRMRSGQYVGTGIDGRTVIIPTEQPFGNNAITFVAVARSDRLIYRTSLEAGDTSINLNASVMAADLIQSIASPNFTVGLTIGGLGDIFPYFTIQAAGLQSIFTYGTFVAVGGADVVSGLSFMPGFVIGKRNFAIDAQWRGSTDAALSSHEWIDTNVNNLGIVSLNADGFTLGTNLSVAGQTVKWIAFKTDGEFVYVIPVLDAGPDQVKNAFTSTAFAPIITTDYPCSGSITTYLWEQISGPVGGSNISNPAIGSGGAVTFTQSGVYVFRLTINDGISIVTDEVQITVINAAPVVNITTLDQNITLSDGGVLNLVATATDDGFPVPPGTLTLQWAMTNGPAAIVFGTPNALTTTVTFTVAGVYEIAFAASDGEFNIGDYIYITVLADCSTPAADPVLCE